MKPTYHLINAVMHHQEHRETFELSELIHRKTLRVGDLAKLMFVFPDADDYSVERMWVKVEQEGETYVGELVNQPNVQGHISQGDRLQFAEFHVINIHPPRPDLGTTLT